MVLPFSLRATLSDGFVVDLDGAYASEEAASRAAAAYVRDYSDPCGLGVRVAYVAILDRRLVEAAR
jgi:hypothetical protein